MDNNKKWWESAEDSNSDSDFFKIPVGDTRVRILTSFVRVNQLSKGEYPNADLLGMVDDTYQAAKDEKVSTQGWAWAIIRATGEIKILTLGTSILKALTTLKMNPEYTFDDLPPYDIIIHNTGVGGDRYSIMAARQNTEVTAEEVAELNKKKAIADIIELIKNKKHGKPVEAPVDYPKEDSSNIPF